MSVGLSIINPTSIVTLLRVESLYSFSNTYNLSFGEVFDPIKKDFKALTKCRLNKDQSMVNKKGSITLNNLNGKIPLFNPFYPKSHHTQLLNLNSLLSECHHQFFHLFYQDQKNDKPIH